MHTHVMQRIGLLCLLLGAALLLLATSCTRPLIDYTYHPTGDTRTKRSEPIMDKQYREAHKLPIR